MTDFVPTVFSPFHNYKDRISMYCSVSSFEYYDVHSPPLSLSLSLSLSICFMSVCYKLSACPPSLSLSLSLSLSVLVCSFSPPSLSLSLLIILLYACYICRSGSLLEIFIKILKKSLFILFSIKT